MKKKLFVTLGILAIMDLTDIIAKGQMLSWFRQFEPDAAESFDKCSDPNSFTKYRGKMIDTISKMFM